MSTIDLQSELDAAIVAVRAAATVCQSVQKNLVTAATLEKKDKNAAISISDAADAIVAETTFNMKTWKKIRCDLYGLKPSAGGNMPKESIAASVLVGSLGKGLKM